MMNDNQNKFSIWFPSFLPLFQEFYIRANGLYWIIISDEKITIIKNDLLFLQDLHGGGRVEVGHGMV